VAFPLNNPDVTASETDIPPSADSWEGILANLRRRYPGQKDSVLFCINKLQQNSELTLRDFRAEAELYGIPMAGRSLHSARMLLGLIKESTPSSAPPEVAPLSKIVRKAKPGTADDDAAGNSIETKVLAAVRQIQSAAGADSENLRQAIRQAIAILQRALGS
jgi:hypothetical protein